MRNLSIIIQDIYTMSVAQTACNGRDVSPYICGFLNKSFHSHRLMIGPCAWINKTPNVDAASQLMYLLYLILTLY